MPVRSPAEHPGLTAARPARSSPPDPDPERLRRAYLDLLKLALCDLAGTGTGSVGRAEGDVVASRELTGEQLRLRAAGMDWPQHGLTMVGLARLDDLQACVESVVADRVHGDVIEAGAWRGGASILMRAALDSLGADDRTVYVADSFRGFPTRPEPEADSWDRIDYLEAPLEQVRDNFARFGLERGVEFVPGFFEETMPRLGDGSWSVVRLDGDSYQSTSVTLEWLYPRLSQGGYAVIDDYGALEECRRAVDDYRARHGITEPIEEVDWTCVRWRRTSDTPVTRELSAAPAANGGDAVRGAERPAEARVPTFHELGLERELDELRRRLIAAEAEIASLRNSRLMRWTNRLRSR